MTIKIFEHSRINQQIQRSRSTSYVTLMNKIVHTMDALLYQARKKRREKVILNRGNNLHFMRRERVCDMKHRMCRHHPHSPKSVRDNSVVCAYQFPCITNIRVTVDSVSTRRSTCSIRTYRTTYAASLCIYARVAVSSTLRKRRAEMCVGRIMRERRRVLYLYYLCFETRPRQVYQKEEICSRCLKFSNFFT